MPNFRVRLSSGARNQKKLDRKLYDSVKQNVLDVVLGLLKEGANPNAPVGKRKMTAMTRAADPRRDREIERALVGAGGVLDKLSTLHGEIADAGSAGGLASLHGRNLGSRLSFLACSVNESLRRKPPRRMSEVVELSDGAALHDESEADGELELTEAMQAAADRPKGWEFPRAQLKLTVKLGEGQFGLVWAGEATGLVDGEGNTRVAVKQVISKDGEEEFHKEVRIMQALSGCDRVVRLLGICTEGDPKLMVMELMCKGDLKTALRAARPKRSKPSPLSMMQLVRMLQDVALGMAYLASNSVVHRDLAARNCLVDDQYRVKIGDFGLTRNLYSKDYYRHAESAVLPIRWMSIEALTDGVYTTAGDVWSFGVVIWEVVTFAKMPYSIWTNHEVYENVVDDDYRLPRPKDCPQAVYALTALCWKEEPGQRATFAQLADKLGALAPTMPSAPLEQKIKGDPTATKEGTPGQPDRGEYDNAEAGGPGPMVSDYEVPASGAQALEDDGAETDDSFETEGLEFMDPATLEPTPAYYSQTAESFTEVKGGISRSPTKWVKT